MLNEKRNVEMMKKNKTHLIFILLIKVQS